MDRIDRIRHFRFWIKNLKTAFSALLLSCLSCPSLLISALRSLILRVSIVGGVYDGK
jgi:hypothetical protein